MNAGREITETVKMKITSQEMFIEVQEILINEMGYQWSSNGKKIYNDKSFTAIQINYYNKILYSIASWGSYNLPEITLEQLKGEIIYELW